MNEFNGKKLTESQVTSLRKLKNKLYQIEIRSAEEYFQFLKFSSIMGIKWRGGSTQMLRRGMFVPYFQPTPEKFCVNYAGEGISQGGVPRLPIMKFSSLLNKFAYIVENEHIYQIINAYLFTKIAISSIAREEEFLRKLKERT